MSSWYFLLVVLAQAFLVGGQIFLKHALNGTGKGAETAIWKQVHRSHMASV